MERVGALLPCLKTSAIVAFYLPRPFICRERAGPLDGDVRAFLLATKITDKTFLV